MRCQHIHTYWIEEGLLCPVCGLIVGVTCELCGGLGFNDDDNENDWFDLSADDPVCPDCNGTGYISTEE